ncbi:MAG: Rrf2 family transcriptional regulator [Bacillota bacterium]|nr:Rrf2 family transcriptional regulator [Bacillota bacterium]
MITKKAEYAILILAELAAHPDDTVLTSREIATRRSIPANLVIQLMPLLHESGWTTGTRGPGGGIKLAINPASITLREVIEKVDGTIGITRCLFSNQPCGNKSHCSLRDIWIKAQTNMLSVFEEASIKELARAMARDN